MHLILDIFQGIGIAAAIGIRPFLPVLLVGALAAGNVQVDFSHTDYSFLESAPFLLIAVIAAIGLVVLERRIGLERTERPPIAIVLAVVAVGLGALEFAGALAQDRYTVIPGYVAGAACAAVGFAATLPLFARVRARLDAAAASALPAYAEGAALVLAGLSVLLPPVGLAGLLLLVWLLLSGRRQQGKKYAGLRILR